MLTTKTLPEVTVNEFTVLQRIFSRGDLKENSTAADIYVFIALLQGMVERGLCFRYDDNYGPAWSLTSKGCDVVRAGPPEGEPDENDESADAED